MTKLATFISFVLVNDVIEVDYLTFGLKIVLNTFMQSNAGQLITDAGGGTVDISVYRYALSSLLWSSFFPSGFRMESRDSSTVVSTAMSPNLES